MPNILCIATVRSYFKDIGIVDGVDYSRHEASQLGQIRNKKTKQILVSSTTDYQTSTVQTEQGRENVLFNRLVATAWLTHLRGEGQDEMDHKDSQTRNNNVPNLRWMTHRENIVAARGCPVVVQEIGKEDYLAFDYLKDCQEHFRDQYGDLSTYSRFNDIFEVGDHIFCRQEKQSLIKEYWYRDV